MSENASSFCRVGSLLIGDVKDDHQVNLSGQRLVVVRYYLDRPGYDLHNSSSRLWKNPPPIVKASDIGSFLEEQGIVTPPPKNGSRGTLVEAFLDTFGSFMLLEVCGENGIEFDFSNTSAKSPGILNIRLTDLREHLFGEGGAAPPNAAHPVQQRCNTSPVGLFAFSMTVAFDALFILNGLVDQAVENSFVLTFGPYAFFVSGLLQFVVGLNEISRNNIFGATAFLGFGCFWLANGTQLIISIYFPDEIPDVLIGAPVVGNFLREILIMLFACALWYQTLILNKLLTGLVSTLIVYLLVASLTGWTDVCKWMKMILGFVLTLEGLGLFFAELTNEVYQREVIPLFPWKKDSPSEVLGAAGRVNTLQSRAIELRTARVSVTNHVASNGSPLEAEVPAGKRHSTYDVRAAQPPIKE